MEERNANESKGGISSAGGSVTLGMVADLWEAEEQQYAIAFVVLSSVGGTSVSRTYEARSANSMV